MRTIKRFALAATLVTALTGAGAASALSAENTSTTPVATGLTALDTLQGKKTCGMGSATVLTAMIQAKPSPTCGCGKVCPLENPPASCGPDEKVAKVKAECNFNILCDGVAIPCSLKVKVETCVPKNGPKTDV